MGNSMLVAQIVLGIYGALLAVGGIVGFLKAGSRPSMIAGLTSAALVFGCLALTFINAELGRILGLTLSLLLGVWFGYRYANRPKLMPSGLLAVLSGIVLLVLFLSDTSG